MNEHTCTFTSAYDCSACIAVSQAEAARMVRAARGRWLVVYESGGAERHRSRSRARGIARYLIDMGIPARVIRYQRKRVRFDPAMPGLEVADEHWLPRPSRHPDAPRCGESDWP